MDTQPLALAIDYYDVLHLDSSAVPPLTPARVDLAASQREQETLRQAHLSLALRTQRLSDIEFARRILRDAERRRRYDALMTGWNAGQRGPERLNALRQLQEEIAAELQHSNRQRSGDGYARLRDGQEALKRGRMREALDLLREAAAALPDDPDTQLVFARAMLSSDDPLALSGHRLRELHTALEQLKHLAPHHPELGTMNVLVGGLIARDEGNGYVAEQKFRSAIARDPQSALAWRGIAEITLHGGDPQVALDAAQRAAAIDPRDERAWLLVIAAGQNLGRHRAVREAAAQVAALRGADWSIDRVLREM
jgi:predicted Zn-dependent protease